MQNSSSVIHFSLVFQALETTKQKISTVYSKPTPGFVKAQTKVGLLEKSHQSLSLDSMSESSSCAPSDHRTRARWHSRLKYAAGIVICFLREAQLGWSTCLPVRSCLSPNFQLGQLGSKERSGDVPQVTLWVSGSHGDQEAPGSTFLGLITSPDLQHQPPALPLAKQRLHVGKTLSK